MNFNTCACDLWYSEPHKDISFNRLPSQRGEIAVLQKEYVRDPRKEPMTETE